MRPRLFTALAVTSAMVLASVPFTGSSAAPAGPPIDPGPPSGVATAASAEETLAAVRSAFAVKNDQPPAARAKALEASREVTLLLRDLRAGLDDLSARDQEIARGYLSRPTGTPAWGGEPVYGVGANPTDSCTEAPAVVSNICVHWATATDDAPNLLDLDGNHLPDSVDIFLDTFDNVWTKVVDDGLYRAPRDDSASADHGPDGRLDIYLANIGPSFLYGYCTSDDPDFAAYAISAYCVLDNDYSIAEYPTNTPLQNLQVTAAHEFFHAVQYAYDWSEDGWLLEGLAAWIEDELYDAVNDNRQYLAASPLSDAGLPLDYANGLYVYGSWIWWRFLSERWAGKQGTGLPVVIRDVLERAGGQVGSPTTRGTYSIKAVDQAIRARGASLRRVLSEFGVANRNPAVNYYEGAAYPRVPVAFAETLTKRHRRSNLVVDSDHLSNATLRFKPAAGFTDRRWKLRIVIDAPPRAHGHGVSVVVFKRNGSKNVIWMGLNKSGGGAKTVAFDRKRVTRVEVTVTNASTRFVCWRNLGYSCQGEPKDDGVKNTVKVTAFR